MKIIKYLFLAMLLSWSSSCVDLDVSPVNVVQNDVIFTTESGVNTYIARIYSGLPIEDFRYSVERMFNDSYILRQQSCTTGEAISREMSGARNENEWWAPAYEMLRDVNMLMETLPKYADRFTDDQVRNWMGEAYFIRAMTHFALVKRHGGVPYVDKVLQYPDESIENLQLPRSSEEFCWDGIGKDFDEAIARLNESNPKGRINKNAAIAFKSRAMLYAGSIAKYNTISLFDNDKNRVCGIPSEKAKAYFKASYDAAKQLEGKYSLNYKSWAEGDKEAQYKNFVNLFFDEDSPEDIFVKYYLYPSSVHGYDSYNVPAQLKGPNGYSSEVNPTLDFVEMFEGFPKNTDGTLKNLDANGKYEFYNTTMDLFKEVEPRLRATVILPGDLFKGTSIEIRRGIYTGSTASGIDLLLSQGSTSPYPDDKMVSSSGDKQTAYTLPDGTQMNPAGLSGVFVSDNTCAFTGFTVRKYLDEKIPTANVLERRLDQHWVEMRYAEVLLTQAEAACELVAAGEGGADYLDDAFNCINQIRKRAGATLLTDKSQLSDINIVRTERRKELAFENKTLWDLRRWRILDKEQNNRMYRTLMPFYAAENGKYFFDVRFLEKNWRYTYDTRWYYQSIPGGVRSKNPKIIQNPGY